MTSGYLLTLDVSLVWFDFRLRFVTSSFVWVCHQGRIKGGATGAIAPGPRLQEGPP